MSSLARFFEKNNVGGVFMSGWRELLLLRADPWWIWDLGSVIRLRSASTFFLLVLSELLSDVYYVFVSRSMTLVCVGVKTLCSVCVSALLKLEMATKRANDTERKLSIL